ncbi:MAG: dynamin family protein [Thermodesulfobacteriota bacterium]
MNIVSEKYSAIIDETKEILGRLKINVKAHGNEELELKLRSAIENLENLFLIVFVGEFSTGKSSIINALIGEKVLDEGITPTTDKISIIKFGEKKGSDIENDIHTITVPEKSLENLYFVDTPGTNVTIEQHEKITQEFIPRADIIFFIIGAERAVTGSESEFIQFLKEDWKKNIVFLLNKIDIAENDEEYQKLIDHSSSELNRLFNIEPHIIPVSAKLELEEPGNTGSGFDKLRTFLFDTLSEEEKVRLKILGALELSEKLAEETGISIVESIEKIKSDVEKLNDFENRIEGMKEDVIANSSQFTERIKGRLLEFKNRGVEFIDGLIRFENVLKLIRKEKIAKEFEQNVSLQTVKEIEKDLDDMVAWTENSTKNIFDSALKFYRDSIEEENSKLTSPFMQHRLKLMDTVRSELEVRKQQIDPKVLGGNLVDSARSAVASVLGVQVGSLALGATVVSAFSSFIVDITGILTTVALVATAFAILPRKRSNAMKEFSSKVDNLTKELTVSIKSQLTRDLDNVKLQVVDSISPLRNFFRTEEKKLIESNEEIEKIKKKLSEIKATL